jgi:hypothetical protein
VPDSFVPQFDALDDGELPLGNGAPSVAEFYAETTLAVV